MVTHCHKTAGSRRVWRRVAVAAAAAATTAVALLNCSLRVASASPDAHCYENNTDYRGSDVEKVETGSVSSFLSCQELCAEHPQCFFWTWDAANKNCYLKAEAAAASRVTGSSAVGLVSGPKSCLSSAPSVPVCFRLDTDYFGYDIVKVEDGSIAGPNACQIACQETAGCQYWTFVSQTSACYLKDSRALLGYKHGADTVGMISGPRDCLPPISGNVDYVGYDVEKVENGQVTSAAACQHLCRAIPQCFYFTWVSKENNCYLKNSSAIQGRSSNYSTIGMVSGPKVCHSNPPGACYELNVDYFGHDVQKIETGQVTTATMCHELCRGKEACFHWTWVKQTQSCYLKGPYALQGRVQDDTTVGMVSGPKECISPPVPCFEKDVDYRGGLVSEMGPGTTTSAAMCQSFCQASRACYFWTWNRDTRNCYLKDSTASSFWVKDESTIGLVSGPKDCEPLPPACMEVNVDYYGHDIRKIENQQVDSAASCQSHCQATSGCIYWTWVSQTQNCYLKDLHALLGRVQSQQTVGMVSGPKCGGASLRVAGMRGRLGFRIRFRTWLWCVFLVLNRKSFPMCTAQDKMLCFLKNALAPTSRVPRQSTVSGPKFYEGPSMPPPSLPEEPMESCFKTNVEFTGVEIQSLVTNAASQCQSACQANILCSFFTFYRHERRCVLKSSETGKPLRELPVGFAISGMKFCSSNDTHDSVPQCAVYNTEYLGQESGSQATTSSALHCQALCQNSLACNFFTYHSQDGRCVLKQFPSSSTELQAVPRGFAISATKYCDAPETDAPSCAERDMEYLGSIISNVIAASATNCQGLCKENSECDFFTFEGLSSACILKKAYAGGEDKLYKLPKPFAMSATKECTSPGTDPECAENNTMYLGIDTAPIIIVETSSECQKLCQQFADCEYFAFNTMEKRCRLRRPDAACSTVQKLPFPGIVSGPKYCTTPSEPSVDQYAELDVELKNHNLSTSPVAAQNTASCLESCNDEPECYYWTFYSTVDESMACHLKSAGALDGKASFAGAVSGSKGVVITVEVETEYVDANLPKDPVTVTSFRECQEACSHVPECGYWTYYSNRDVNCYLKDFTALESKRTNADGISGSKYSVTGTPPRMYLDDRRYGARVVTVRAVMATALTATSAKGCQEKAQADPQNPYWSWNKFDQTCNLYGPEVLGQDTYDYEWVSGYAESEDTSYPSEAYTYGQGVNLLRLDAFEITVASSPAACAEACASTKLCRVASFARAPSDGTPNCYLGRLGAQRTVPSKEHVAVVQHELVLQVGTKPSSGATHQQPDSNMSQCIELCGRSDRCKRWSLDLSTGTCYLYDKTDAGVPDASYVTADVGILLEEIEEAILVDTALIPVAVDKVVKPISDCAVHCQHSFCLAYSYIVAGAGASDNTCYLGGIGDAADLQRFTKTLKGSVLVRTQSRSVLAELAFAGEPSASRRDQLNTAVSCATACSNAGDCEAWTFRGDENSCELFSSVSTAVAGSSHVVSGTKQADGAALEASPIKMFMAIATSWTNTVLAQQSVQSETECENLCADTPNCVQWSTTTLDDGTLDCVAGSWNAVLEANNNARTSVLSSRFFTPFMELKGTPISTDNPSSSTDPVQHCAKQCETQIAGCQAWTMKIIDSGAQCDYFTEEIAVVSTTNPLAVSGSKGLSDVQAPAVYGTYQRPVAQESSAPSVIECQKDCEADELCVAWSYNYTEETDTCKLIQEPAFQRTAGTGVILVELGHRFLKPFQLLSGELEDIIDTVEGSATKQDLCECLTTCFDNVKCAAWALELTEAGSTCTLYSAFKKESAPGLGISGTRRDAASCESDIADRLLLEEPIMIDSEGTLEDIFKAASSHSSYTVGVSLVTPAAEPPMYKLAKALGHDEVSDSAAAVVVHYVE
uniref:PAN domain-containing protein n=1 Tax=Neospora caninum (strain Liverpool) TaxID=572307 RepID=A0A0F7UM27_NEOCL|nr:TPA: PAN domain-containing protein [Neospora caninum Liverpool]